MLEAAATAIAGPAKQPARERVAAGIDLTDQAAVQRWIDERNEGLPIRRPS